MGAYLSDPSHVVFVVMLCVSFLGSVVSGLKVLDETGSGLKATIAFFTALVSMKDLFAKHFEAPKGDKP